MEHNNSFEYTYSAQQRQEVEAIRKEYLPKEKDKLEQLRALHEGPTKKAQAASIIVGVLGALVLGGGMSLCMTDLAQALGTLSLAAGIAVGMVGIVLTALAYPTYNRILKRERARIAPEILRLSEDLIK